MPIAQEWATIMLRIDMLVVSILAYSKYHY